MTQDHGNGLFGLREALRRHGPATVTQLARQLGHPRGVVQAMLEHWQRRGRVAEVAPAPAGRSHASAGACGSGACARCGSCASAKAPVVEADGDENLRYAWCEQRRVQLLGPRCD